MVAIRAGLGLGAPGVREVRAACEPLDLCFSIVQQRNDRRGDPRQGPAWQASQPAAQAGEGARLIPPATLTVALFLLLPAYLLLLSTIFSVLSLVSLRATHLARMASEVDSSPRTSRSQCSSIQRPRAATADTTTNTMTRGPSLVVCGSRAAGAAGLVMQGPAWSKQGGGGI
jgi:hypothetical protein